MSKIDLTKYGITGTTEIVYNPSYEVLFEEETKASNTGYEVGQNTELNAVNVMTGIYTGRSPKDKYIVEDANSKDTVWWDSKEYPNDNHKMSESTWAAVKDIAKKELQEYIAKNVNVGDVANAVLKSGAAGDVASTVLKSGMAGELLKGVLGGKK